MMGLIKICLSYRFVSVDNGNAEYDNFDLTVAIFMVVLMSCYAFSIAPNIHRMEIATVVKIHGRKCQLLVATMVGT